MKTAALSDAQVKRLWRFRVTRSSSLRRGGARTVLVRANSLKAALLGLGLYADEQARTLGAGVRAWFGGSRACSRTELADFFQLLGAGLRTGHSLTSSLAMVARQSRSARMRGLVGELSLQVQQGRSLAEVMEALGSPFTPSQLALVKASSGMTLKETGALFADLALSLRRDAGLARRLLGAVIYPCLVLCMALVAALILQQKALPPMVELFRSMGVTLHWVTRVFYRLSLVCSEHLFLLLGLATFLFYALWLMVSSLLKCQVIQRLLVRVPYLGSVLRARALSKSLAVFSLLKRSGASSQSMFQHAAEAAGNDLVRSFFLSTYAHVREGDSVEQAFMEERHVLGDDGIRLAGKMELGMAGQDLGPLLADCVEDMSQQAELRLILLPKLLEIPLLILCALVIGSIMLAIFLPYPSLLADLAGRIRS